MRHYALLTGLLLVLAAPFLVRILLVTHSRSPAQLDTRDALELRILTPHNQDIRQTFSRAFSRWHLERFETPVKIVYLTPGGTLDVVRYVADAYAAVRDEKSRALAAETRVSPVAELVWGGGDTTFERELKPYLKPVKLPSGLLSKAFPHPELNGIPLYDSTQNAEAPRWVGVALSSFGILYSPELYRTLGLSDPATWQDLARPELAGFLALADPTRSGSAAIAYMMAIQRAMADAEEDYLAARSQSLSQPASVPGRRILEGEPGYAAALALGWKRGMRTLLLMAANARTFTDSASQPCNDVGNGDAAAALAIDFYARVFQDQLGRERLRYVAPRAATAVTPDPIAVLYGTRGEREVLANRFIEFLLTPEAQRLWNLRAEVSPDVARSLRRLPIRRDVYADRSGFADDVDPFRDSGEFNLRPAWMHAFREIRLVWAAAWIDSRSALLSAYRRILRVPDAARRAALLVELSDLPIEMAEVNAIAAERRALEQGSGAQDFRLWLARMRVSLAARFRNHYQTLEQRAERP